MYVVITGNPIDGIELTGPFDTYEDADEFVSTNKLDEWWIIRLVDPES